MKTLLNQAKNLVTNAETKKQKSSMQLQDMTAKSSTRPKKTKAEMQAVKEQKQREKQQKALMNRMPMSVQKTLQMTTEVWEALASTENNEVIDKEMTPIETLIESVEEQGKTITTLVQVIKIQNAQMQKMSKAVNDLISELNYLRE